MLSVKFPFLRLNTEQIKNHHRAWFSERKTWSTLITTRHSLNPNFNQSQRGGGGGAGFKSVQVENMIIRKQNEKKMFSIS